VEVQKASDHDRIKN